MPSTSQEKDFFDIRVGARVRFAAGSYLFHNSDMPSGWIRIVSGRVKVRLIADTGHEIVLYRIEAGDTCVLTTSALLRHEFVAAEAVAETDVEAWLVPASQFDRLMANDPQFRNAVLESYAERVADMCLLLQDSLFHALTPRLARLLLRLAGPEGVEATHQDLANELGAAREAVTRTLGRLERRGLIAGGRGRIRLTNVRALEALAQESGSL